MLNMHSGIEEMVFNYGVCSTVSFILSDLEISILCITLSSSPSQSVQVRQGVNVSCSRPHRTATRPGLEPGTPWSVVAMLTPAPARPL